MPPQTTVKIWIKVGRGDRWETEWSYKSSGMERKEEILECPTGLSKIVRDDEENHTSPGRAVCTLDTSRNSTLQIG